MIIRGYLLFESWAVERWDLLPRNVVNYMSNEIKWRICLLIAGVQSRRPWKDPSTSNYSMILLGSGYLCGPFGVHWEGASMAMAELCTAASLLHRHLSLITELMGCCWTYCLTLATEIEVNDKLSDLIQLRYIPTSQCSCSPTCNIMTCYHIHAVPEAGLAKPLQAHKVHLKGFTQPRATRDAGELFMCVHEWAHRCAGVCLSTTISQCQELLQLPWVRLVLPDLASTWKQGPWYCAVGTVPFHEYLNIERDKGSYSQFKGKVLRRLTLGWVLAIFSHLRLRQ